MLGEVVLAPKTLVACVCGAEILGLAWIDFEGIDREVVFVAEALFATSEFWSVVIVIDGLLVLEVGFGLPFIEAARVAAVERIKWCVWLCWVAIYAAAEPVANTTGTTARYSVLLCKSNRMLITLCWRD